jgi:starvation-inducible DNA-binding protein
MNNAKPITPRLKTPTDLGANATKDLSAALNAVLADAFALYMKTKNFHWHMSGPHFRDYHLLLDEHSDQIFATTDVIAERVRKIGGNTLRSIGDIASKQTIADNEASYVPPEDMLAELHADTLHTIKAMRAAHEICDEHDDVASASLLENFIDAAEKRGGLFVEHQVIVAEVRTADVPMEVLGLHEKREGIGQNSIQRIRDGFGGVALEVGRRLQPLRRLGSHGKCPLLEITSPG